MTDEHISEHGDEERIEDLNAPATAQGDVAGGQCPKETHIMWGCVGDTCKATDARCTDNSAVIMVSEM
jgi:hypothetical protein